MPTRHDSKPDTREKIQANTQYPNRTPQNLLAQTFELKGSLVTIELHLRGKEFFFIVEITAHLRNTELDVELTRYLNYPVDLLQLKYWGIAYKDIRYMSGLTPQVG